MTLKRLFATLLIWAACIAGAHAQLSVTLQLPRTMYLVDEPLTATLNITNRAGREIVLEDNARDGTWCLFQIKAVRGGYVPSRRPDLTFPSISIPAGETVSRSVNLTELYDLNESGQYRIRACVNFAPTRSQFWSEPVVASTDSGKLLWSQTVGVPDGRPDAGAFRTFSLLTLQRQDGIYLFAKLEGKEEGIRFPTYALGRLLGAMQPQPEFDDANNLYVFHATNDTSYTLSQIDVATGKMGQALYKSSIAGRQGRPSMRRSRDGHLTIAGGVRVAEEEIAAESSPTKARLTDRPAGF
jgi:hypothetical protein